MAGGPEAQRESGVAAGRRGRERAVASAELALSLAELLRAGTVLPQALTAMALRRRQGGDALAPVFERMAVAVRDGGQSLFAAVQAERAVFTPRLVALLALANLGGPLFRTVVRRLREWVTAFNALPAGADDDFPPFEDEVREFCYLFGHLTAEGASQPEVQRWLPQVFTPRLRLVVTHVLARFYDQGLLLSEAFERTPPFHDAEMVLAVQAGEALNRVGAELIELADWLGARKRLEERLRLGDLVMPGRLGGGGGC